MSDEPDDGAGQTPEPGARGGPRFKGGPPPTPADGADVTTGAAGTVPPSGPGTASGPVPPARPGVGPGAAPGAGPQAWDRPSSELTDIYRPAKSGGRLSFVLALVLVVAALGLVGLIVVRTVSDPDTGWTELDRRGQERALEGVCEDGRSFDDAMPFEAGAPGQLGITWADEGGHGLPFGLGADGADDADLAEVSLVACTRLVEATVRVSCEMAVESGAVELITAGLFEVELISLQTGETLATEDNVPVAFGTCPNTATQNAAGEVVDDTSIDVRNEILVIAQEQAVALHGG